MMRFSRLCRRDLVVPAFERVTSAVPSRRHLATSGTRGSRGHGWFTNYRAGKGGRHLQGEYYGEADLETCKEWNEIMLDLGHQVVFLDVDMVKKGSSDETGSEDRVRLEMRLASAVMPETTNAILSLIDSGAYSRNSKLERFDRNVGIRGGTLRPILPVTDIVDDPLPLFHYAGTVTFLVPTVGQIDSRFLLCTHEARHMNGMHRAVGQLTDESLAKLQTWESDLVTQHGVPTAYDLLITGCGRMSSSSPPSPVEGGASSQPVLTSEEQAVA